MAGQNIVTPKKIDFGASADLGLEESIREMFANIGWEKFLDLDTMVYTELVREFYKNLEVKQSRDGEYWSIEFVLLGKREVLNANQINIELGVTELARMIRDDFKNVTKQLPALSKAKANKMWEELARKEEFTSDIGRAASLKTPTLIVCHMILAINFSGKTDSGNTVSSNELYILWAMTQKEELNFGGFVIAQLRNILTKANQRMSLGVLPTYLAKRRGEPKKVVLTIEQGGVLDMVILKRILNIEKGRDGKWKLVDKAKKPLAKP